MNVEELRRKVRSTIATNAACGIPSAWTQRSALSWPTLTSWPQLPPWMSRSRSQSHPAVAGGPTQRRSLGDPAPDVAMTRAAEAAIESLRANAQAISARAAESGDLIVAVFGAVPGEDMERAPQERL